MKILYFIYINEKTKKKYRKFTLSNFYYYSKKKNYYISLHTHTQLSRYTNTFVTVHLKSTSNVRIQITQQTIYLTLHIISQLLMHMKSPARSICESKIHTHTHVRTSHTHPVSLAKVSPETGNCLSKRISRNLKCAISAQVHTNVATQTDV